jgi:hypothetical protein
VVGGYVDSFRELHTEHSVHFVMKLHPDIVSSLQVCVHT